MGICRYNIEKMSICTGKRCGECESSPAFKKGFKAGTKVANKRIHRLIKNITECVWQETYDKGYKDCKSKVAADEWKTCEESLPKDYETIIAIVKFSAWGNEIMLAGYSEKDGWWLTGHPSFKDFKIIKWASINNTIE